MVIELANGLGNRCTMLGLVIPKTRKKWYLIPSFLTLKIIRYGSRVSGGI